MSDQDRPVPRARPESLPFWDGCKHDTFMLQYCNHCGKLNWFPRAYCMQCGGGDFIWKPASGVGVLEMYSVVHRPMSAAWKTEVPYILGMVRLAEGPRMVTRIISDRWETTPLDCTVKAIFEPVGKGMKLPYFKVV